MAPTASTACEQSATPRPVQLQAAAASIAIFTALVKEIPCNPAGD